MLKIQGTRNYLYQWDLNQKVIVIDNDSVNEVHFVNDGQNDNALIVEVKEDPKVRYAEIPNILLQSGDNIIAYEHCEDNGEYTFRKYLLEVIRRPKPADYVYTETEIKSYEALQADLDKKIDAPQVAQVGEVLTVEEVDEDGKPIKWKTQTVDIDGVLKYTEQELTSEERAQTRENISVVGGKELNGLGELEISSDTSFCIVKEYDTTASNLGLTNDEFPMLIIKSAHIWYGRQDFYALSKTGKLYNGVVGNDIQTWNEMTKRIVVNVSRTEEESGAVVISTDKTYWEIDAAIKSNCDVALNFDGDVFTWSQTVKNVNHSTYVFQRTDVQHSRILSIGITGTNAGKTVVQQKTHSTPILMTNENTPPTGSVVTWIEAGYGLVSIEELLYYIPLHSILIKSSTEGSTKKFRVTVDDSGTLTATEFTGMPA